VSELETVQDYIVAARELLQDTVPASYRYPDADLLRGIGTGLLEARRLRPDLFMGVKTIPKYTAVNATVVPLDEQYRSALLYYIIGRASLRDEENSQDSRGVAFLNKFVSQLQTMPA